MSSQRSATSSEALRPWRYPNGHREIEGVTPKQLPAPDASHTLPNSNSSDENINDINEEKA
jgi:hypothetical protein